jgi:hypothetical protein
MLFGLAAPAFARHACPWQLKDGRVRAYCASKMGGVRQAGGGQDFVFDFPHSR